MAVSGNGFEKFVASGARISGSVKQTLRKNRHEVDLQSPVVKIDHATAILRIGIGIGIGTP